MNKKSALLLCLIFLLLNSCAKKEAPIPRQTSDLDQFYFAMETYYFPGESAESEEKKVLLRKAADALEAVRTYFPDSGSKLLVMETYFYQGVCLKLLEEFKNSVNAFWACFSVEDVPSEAINAYEAGMMSYKNDAWFALMELREYLPPEYTRVLDGYKPLP